MGKEENLQHLEGTTHNAQGTTPAAGSSSGCCLSCTSVRNLVTLRCVLALVLGFGVLLSALFWLPFFHFGDRQDLDLDYQGYASLEVDNIIGCTLKIYSLQRAQDRMAASANKKRRDVEFAVGDMVYVRFRPHRQSTLFSSRNRKMAPRFFGPFWIEARIGATAYRLQLPATARIHPVFHVSLLKRAIGEATTEPTLPDGLDETDPPCLPEKVLDARTEQREGEAVGQVLVKWRGMGNDEATWMDVADVQGQFPFFSLADKAVSTGGAVDTPGAWKVYRRGNRGVVWPVEKNGEAGAAGGGK